MAEAESPAPVGFFCTHEDEPVDARTHHAWKWDDDKGDRIWAHDPTVISSHTGPHEWDEEQRVCTRALPVYAVDVPALLADLAAAQRERDRYRTSLPAEVQDYWFWRHRAEQAEAERDKARADLTEQTARNGELIVEMQRTRQAADEALAEMARAEAVCLMLGWTGSILDTTRTKALHQLWRNWSDSKPDSFMDPANHPELSDEAIERLARQRDESRDRTLAAIRGEGADRV